MTDSLTLYIGEKNISSWSMRAHVALNFKQLRFDERPISLVADRDRVERRRISPTGRVPVLHHGNRVIPDSLAIIEYLEEAFPPPRYPALWPGEAGARAHARWLAAAMHAGFPRLREEMAFHRCFQKQVVEPAEDARAEAAELLSLLQSALQLKPQGGPFLFGEFGAVDAMYAPVAVRLKRFDVPLGPTPLAGAYLDAVLGHRAVRIWMDAARALPEPPLR